MYTAWFDHEGLTIDELRQFKAVYERVCSIMERKGYDHIDAITSEEAFEQACELNEWTFREDGTMENA
jgi:hypothetical protein